MSPLPREGQQRISFFALPQMPLPEQKTRQIQQDLTGFSGRRATAPGSAEKIAANGPAFYIGVGLIILFDLLQTLRTVCKKSGVAARSSIDSHLRHILEKLCYAPPALPP